LNPACHLADRILAIPAANGIFQEYSIFSAGLMGWSGIMRNFKTT
jgi:hypothetical protein